VHVYLFRFYYILSCILWRLFMLSDLSYVEDMTFMLRCICFCCDFMLEFYSCMTMLVIICRSDDYFWCIYLNCMIYCLIRNRALHKHQLQCLIWCGIRMFLWRSQCLCDGYFKTGCLLKIIWLGAVLFRLKITFV